MTPAEPITDAALEQVRVAMVLASDPMILTKRELARILARLDEKERALASMSVDARSIYEAEGDADTADDAIGIIAAGLLAARRAGLKRAEEITRQWLSETCYGANDYDHGLEDAAKQIADAIAKEAEK